MSIDEPRGSVKTRIGDPPHAHAAVVIGNIFDQPVDGVPGIGGLVEILGPGLHHLVRTHVLILSLGHPTAAHVLINEDVAFLFEQEGRAHGVAIAIAAVRDHAVGCARKQDGIRLGEILGHIDGREKPDAVTHADGALILGVVGSSVFEVLSSERGSQDKKIGRAENTDPERPETHGKVLLETIVRLRL